MKKQFLIISIAVLAACNSEKKEPASADKLSADLVNNPVSADGNNEQTLSEMPTMDFTDTTHNFGAMQEGEVVTYDFEFKNNGKKPLESMRS